MAFKSAIGRLVQLNASLERVLFDFGANLLSHISNHVVYPSANGVIRERNLLDYFFAPDPIIISTIFSAHGLISSSAIVCNFSHFAIQYPIL